MAQNNQNPQKNQNNQRNERRQGSTSTETNRVDRSSSGGQDINQSPQGSRSEGEMNR